MDEFHTDHSFQQALFNRVDRVRFLHHDIDFSVACGGGSDSRRSTNSAKTQRQRVSIVDLIDSIFISFRSSDSQSKELVIAVEK
jgi:hypothetical protein